MTTAPDRLLRRLEWQVVRKLDGRLSGAYRTVFRGTGIDFTDLRGYLPEDDVRHIDWNVTARMDEPFVRQYTHDRDLTAWLVVDRSASMNFGADGHDKRAVAAELAVCLGRLFAAGGNRVGAVLYDNRAHQVIPDRTGRNHLLRLTHALTSAGDPAGDGRPTDLDAMLRLAGSVARRRSLVFVISDFIGDSDWEPALTRLGRRHEVVTVRVVDPAELDLPDVGLVLVEDAETGEQMFADTGDPLFRNRLRAQVEARETAVSSVMRRAGADAHRVGTEVDLVTSLVDMVRRPKRARR